MRGAAGEGRVAEPPRLETPRLVLRGFRQDDLEAHAAMAGDPEVARFLGGVADRPDAWRAMAMHAGHWALRGYGNWALERKQDGAMIGRAGLWYPEGWPGVEVGWKLAREAWGQGYATEAARAAVEWAWANLDVPRLLSVIAPDNQRSIRVAERLGSRFLREDVVGGECVHLYALERPA